MTTRPRIRLTDMLRHAPSRSQFRLRGRAQELDRVAYTLGRASQHNLMVSGPRGIGKTALIHGFVQAVVQGKFAALRPLPYLALDTAHTAALLRDTQKKDQAVQQLAIALQHLPDCVFVVDDADTLLSALPEPWHFEELFSAFYNTVHRHLVLVVPPARLEALQRTPDSVPKYFDVLELTEVPTAVCAVIIADHAAALARRHRVHIMNDTVAAVLRVTRPDALTALPRRALHTLDEACAACVVRKENTVTPEHVAHVRAQRLGLPTPQLARQRTDALRNLEATLSRRVRGQQAAVHAVADVVRRGWLGLKNPQRPVGSFLFLGPSGVGKTELAKALAEEVYGSPRACVRVDMSEFGEPHTVQRLLGAPPGYVGYEAGGQLTNPIRQQPFSVVLLDEIEKAHPSVFDIFLQLLDDGRLTDGQGQEVDFTNTIVIATSNIGTAQIAAAVEHGLRADSKEVFRRVVMPQLLIKFRTEFINRFDHVAVFNPLSPEVLFEIAQHEVEKIERRLAAHHIKIHLDQDAVRAKIAELYDPRFGARPLKRYLEATCENILAERLLRV